MSGSHVKIWVEVVHSGGSYAYSTFPMARVSDYRPASSMTAAIAAEVRAHVARQQIKQQAIADALGRTQSWVSRRLTGEVPFTVADLDAICGLLNLTLLELVEGMPQPPNEGALDRRDQRRRTSICNIDPESLLLVA